MLRRDAALRSRTLLASRGTALSRAAMVQAAAENQGDWMAGLEAPAADQDPIEEWFNRLPEPGTVEAEVEKERVGWCCATVEVLAMVASGLLALGAVAQLAVLMGMEPCRATIGLEWAAATGGPPLSHSTARSAVTAECLEWTAWYHLGRLWEPSGEPSRNRPNWPTESSGLEVDGWDLGGSLVHGGFRPGTAFTQLWRECLQVWAAATPVAAWLRGQWLQWLEPAGRAWRD
jgi:hypothetical protein